MQVKTNKTLVLTPETGSFPVPASAGFDLTGSFGQE